MTLPLLSAWLLPSQAAGDEWKEKLKSITADMKPVEGKVSIELPDIASHGNSVPVKVLVDNPMTQELYIDNITLLSNHPADPLLAEFRLSPLNGKAEVSTYIKLDKDQEIMALAKTNKGQFFLGRRLAQVKPSSEF